MSSMVMEPEAWPDNEPVAGAAGDAEALCTLIEKVRTADHLIAEAVLLAGRLAGSGASERVEGLPLEQLLGLGARLTGADRRMLVNAGEVLRDLPAVSGLFTAGELSWGQVRAVVGAAKVLRKADRETLDARVRETVAERGGVEGFDADQLVWAVYAAVEELTDPRRLERREQHRAERNFLAVQGKLDGGISVYGEFDPTAGATIVGALDTASATPGTNPDQATDGNADQDSDAGDAGDGAGDAGEGRVGPSPATTAGRGRAGRPLPPPNQSEQIRTSPAARRLAAVVAGLGPTRPSPASASASESESALSGSASGVALAASRAPTMVAPAVGSNSP
jgi:hypothetical protein